MKPPSNSVAGPASEHTQGTLIVPAAGAAARGQSGAERAQRRFIRIAAGTGVALLFWLAFVSYQSMEDFVSATDQRSQASRISSATQLLVYLLREAESAQRAFVLLGEESYLVPYYEAKREIPMAFDRLQLYTDLPGRQRERFQALRILIGDRLQALARQIEDKRSNRSEASAIAPDSEADESRHARIRALVMEIHGDVQRMLTEEYAVALKNRQRSLFAFVLAVVLALVVIAALVLWHERSLRLRDIEALRESEERFGQVATMAGEWLWEQDAYGRFLYSNDAVKTILGYAPEDVLGRSYFELFNRAAREQVLKGVYSEENRRRFSRLINHYQHKDGHEVITESTGIPLFDSQGRIVKWRGVDLDISLRLQFEEVLREREELFRLTLDNASIGIITVDLEGRLLTLNPAFCRLLGYEANELSGKALRELICVEDRPGFQGLWRAVAGGEQTLDGQAQVFLRRDGSAVTLRAHTVLALDPAGRPRFIVAEFDRVVQDAA